MTLPVPTVGQGEVLIKVAAAGIYNTDINTRIGWYSKRVKSGTEEGATQGFESSQDADGAQPGPAFRCPFREFREVTAVIASSLRNERRSCHS